MDCKLPLLLELNEVGADQPVARDQSAVHRTSHAAQRMGVNVSYAVEKAW